MSAHLKIPCWRNSLTGGAGFVFICLFLFRSRKWIIHLSVTQKIQGLTAWLKFPKLLKDTWIPIFSWNCVQSKPHLMTILIIWVLYQKLQDAVVIFFNVYCCKTSVGNSEWTGHLKYFPVVPLIIGSCLTLSYASFQAGHI